MHNVHVIFSFPFLSFIFSHRRCRFSSTATTGLRMHRLIAFLDGLETAVGHHYLSTSVTPLPKTGIEERMTKSITAVTGQSMSLIHRRAPPPTYKMSTHRRAPPPTYKMSTYHRTQDNKTLPTSTRPPTSSISCQSLEQQLHWQDAIHGSDFGQLDPRCHDGWPP
jgi:hypothetical protein